MKCLLLNSPIYREHSDEKEDYLPPLGLGYIATHLIKSGIEAKIIDCVKERLGISDIFEVLNKQSPDYIGINIFTQNYEIVKEIVENCPINTSIIIGGQVVKCIFNDVLQWNVRNKLIIIIGEGEFIIPTLIKGTCNESPIFKSGEKYVYRVDKNSIYFPKDLSATLLDRSLFKEYMIINHYGDYEAAIVTSRDCMYNCAFCGGAHNLNKDITIRHRRISDVEREIKDIISATPSITSIRMLDDLFLRDAVSINNAVAMFEGIGNLTWRGMAHVLTFVKSFESLPALKQSGCRELFIGIESGSPRIREKINKPGTVQQIIDVISAILDVGIDVKGYFMFGFPKETLSDAEATYSLASTLMDISKNKKGSFRTSVFQFRPYHGTQLYNELLQSGNKIMPIKSNTALNIIDGRSQFNFQSGNYSDIEDEILYEFVLKTQLLSRDTNV